MNKQPIEIVVLNERHHQVEQWSQRMTVKQ